MMEHSTTIRLIATDIDGTLLNSKKIISEKTREYLIALQQQGVRIALCSGRAPYEMSAFVDTLRLREFDGYLIYSNGAGLIRLRDESAVHFSPLQGEELAHLLDLIRQHHLYVLSEHQGRYLVECSDWVERKRRFAKKHAKGLRKLFHHVRYTNFIYMSQQADRVDHLLHHLQGSADKLIVRGKPKDLERMLDAIMHKEDYHCYRLTKSCVEINHADVSKANALHSLQQELGLTQEAVAVFGDSPNDHEMLSEFKISVAMGNADAKTKSIASFQTLTNDEDGIVHFMQTLTKENAVHAG